MAPPPKYHTDLEKKVDQHGYELKSVIEGSTSTRDGVEKLREKVAESKSEQDGRIATQDSRIGKLEEKCNSTHEKHEKLENRVWTVLYWAIGAFFVAILSLVGIIVTLLIALSNARK